MTLWSDPNPSGATAAALGRGLQLQGHENIGSLVSAILLNRYRQEQQQRQDMQSIASAIGSIGQRAQQQKDQGNLAAFEQSGLTDQSDALINPDQQALIDKMSPGAKEQAMQWIQQQQGQSDKSDMQQQLIDSRSNASDALANQRWTGNTRTGTDPTLTSRRQQLIDQGNLAAVKQEVMNTTGATPQTFPAIASKLNSYRSGIDPFPVGGNDVPGDQKQAMVDAVQRYMGLLHSGNTAPRPTLPNAPASVDPPLPTGGASNMSPEDQEALQWATANPDDPRAARILARLGQ